LNILASFYSQSLIMRHGTHLGTLYSYPLAVMGEVGFEPPIRLIPNEQAP